MVGVSHKCICESEPCRGLKAFARQVNSCARQFLPRQRYTPGDNRHLSRIMHQTQTPEKPYEKAKPLRYGDRYPWPWIKVGQSTHGSGREGRGAPAKWNQHRELSVAEHRAKYDG